MALDFDGTLARIVREPRAARLARATGVALAAVARRYPVAILSGRSAQDVRSRLEGIDVPWVIGNHGAEWPGEPAQPAWRTLVSSWAHALQRRLADVEGIELEEKGLSLSIHWRRAKDSSTASALALRAAMRAPGASVIPGKKVLSLVPAGAPDKGSALRRLVSETGCRRAIFVGDDATDEAAFRERLPGAVRVRVGRAVGSAAEYYVRQRAGVDEVLRRLVARWAPLPEGKAR